MQEAVTKLHCYWSSVLFCPPQARKHMKEKFPASEDLMTSDEKQLREILEKVGPRTRGRDMLETFNPDAFTSKNSD